MSRPRWAASSPGARREPPAEPPLLPTVAWTAARASGLMAATWGAISFDSGPTGCRGGPRLDSPENGDETGPVIGWVPVSSAAQCRSGGSEPGPTGRIWPVSLSGDGPRRPLSNGDGGEAGVGGTGPRGEPRSRRDGGVPLRSEGADGCRPRSEGERGGMPFMPFTSLRPGGWTRSAGGRVPSAGRRGGRLSPERVGGPAGSVGRTRGTLSTERIESVLGDVAEYEPPFVRVPGRTVPDWLEPLVTD